MLDKITPIIIAFNEEANIGRVLEALKWAKHILVIDSYSSDQTLAICKKYNNVEVVQRKFDNFSDQRNFALRHKLIQTEWVLSLDSDFVLTDALIKEMCSLEPSSDITGYEVHFKYCVEGHLLRAALYPPLVVLFKPASAEYVQDGHSQRLKIQGTVTRLKGRIIHDDQKPLDHWLMAQKKYAAEEAMKIHLTLWKDLNLNDKIRKCRVFAPILVFFYCLFIKGLIFNGVPGLYYSFQRLYAETLLSLFLCHKNLNNKLQTKFGS